MPAPAVCLRPHPGVRRGRSKSSLSMTIVTGPSLVSETCMWAPKRPLATRMPCAARAHTKAAFSRVAVEGELADDQRFAAHVDQGAVKAAALVREDA